MKIPGEKCVTEHKMRANKQKKYENTQHKKSRR